MARIITMQDMVMPKPLKFSSQPDSAYVKAATEGSLNVNKVNVFLTHDDNRANNGENYRALRAAIHANALEIVRIIIEKAINPYLGTKQNETIKTLIENALSFATYPVQAYLLQQKPVQQYLQTSLKVDDRFHNLLTRMADLGRKRAVCEITEYLDIHGIARLNNNDLDSERKETSNEFKLLIESLQKGAVVNIKALNKKLPCLPGKLIELIFDYAVSDNDILDQAITKKQILKLCS